MKPEKREHSEPQTSVAIVAPVWLQNALIVLLHAETDLKLVACTATVQVLLSLDLEKTPELVILETDEQRERVEEQVGRIKTVWPTSSCIALVEHSKQKADLQAAGADVTLLKGVTPQQLMTAIRQLRKGNEDEGLNTFPKDQKTAH